MSRNLRGRLLSWSKVPENRRIVKAAGLIIALGILVTGADMACSRTQMTPSIERNDYGKGKKVEELDIPCKKTNRGTVYHLVRLG